MADDRLREPSRRGEHRRPAVLRQDVPGDGRARGAARGRAPGRARRASPRWWRSRSSPSCSGAGESRTSAFVASYLPDHPQASSEVDLQRLPELVARSPSALLSRTSAVDDCRAAILRRLRERSLPQRAPLACGRSESGRAGGALRQRAWRHIEEAGGHSSCRSSTGRTAARRLARQGDAGRSSARAHHAGQLGPGARRGHHVDHRLRLWRLQLAPDAGQHQLQHAALGLHSACDARTSRGSASSCSSTTRSTCWVSLPPSRWDSTTAAGSTSTASACLQVCTWTSPRAPQVHLDVQVLRGGPVRLALTHQFDGLNGWTDQRRCGTMSSSRSRAPTACSPGRFPRAQFRMIVNSRDSRAERAPRCEAPTARGSAAERDFRPRSAGRSPRSA